jgi:hypothetical protein
MNSIPHFESLSDVLWPFVQRICGSKIDSQQEDMEESWTQSYKTDYANAKILSIGS